MSGGFRRGAVTSRHLVSAHLVALVLPPSARVCNKAALRVQASRMADLSCGSSSSSLSTSVSVPMLAQDRGYEKGAIGGLMCATCDRGACT